MQRLDKGKIFRIVAADYEVEKNACGAMTNRKAMNLAEYDRTVLYSLFLMWLLMCDYHGLVIICFCVDMLI